VYPAWQRILSLVQRKWLNVRRKNVGEERHRELGRSHSSAATWREKRDLSVGVNPIFETA